MEPYFLPCWSERSFGLLRALHREVKRHEASYPSAPIRKGDATGLATSERGEMVKRYDDSVNEELRETVKLRKIVGSFSIPDPVSSQGHSRRKGVGTVGVTIH